MLREESLYKAFVRFFWFLVIWALTGAASAQEFARLYASSAFIKLEQPLEWVAVPKGSVVNPEMFDRDPKQWKFSTYLPDTTLPTNKQQEVWLRFALPSTELAQTWFLRVPRLTVWRVDLFFRSEQERWVSMSAGYSMAPAQWALRTRTPSFEVQTRTDKVQTYFMRFQHDVPITEVPQLITPIEYVDGASRVGTVIGLLFGLFGLLAVVSVAAYRMLRNSVFLWFGGFVLAMLLTQLMLIGYGGWRIWPHSVYLNQSMAWMLPALTLALGTWFIVQASHVRQGYPWLYKYMAALTAGSLLLVLVAAGQMEFVTRQARSMWVGFVTISAVGVLAWTALRGQAWNWWLLLGFGPIGFGVMARLGYNFGWVPHAEFAQAAGIFSSSFGLLWIFFVLAWRSRASWVTLERAAAVDTFDSATGLIHGRVGQIRLPLMLQRGARFESGCGVIMLQWVDFNSTIMKLSAELRGAALARLGLILRRQARDIDSVVRHSDKEFLIFVEGPVDRVSLVELCSKILYECLRSSEKMGQGNIFNLHVAVWQSSSGISSAEEVMDALQTQLNQMSHGTQRRVQFVDANKSEPQTLTDQDIAARRDDVLAKIKAIEATPIVPTVYLAPRNREAQAPDSETSSRPASTPNSTPASRLDSRPDSRPASKPTAR